MQPSRIISDPLRVWAFVHTLAKVPATAGMQGIGLLRDARAIDLIAGVVYEGYTGHTIWMHVGATPGAVWAKKDFLKAVFAYPFETLKLPAVRGWVAATNTAARSFNARCGFEQEAVLRGAAQDGADAIILRLPRERCKFI